MDAHLLKLVEEQPDLPRRLLLHVRDEEVVALSGDLDLLGPAPRAGEEGVAQDLREARAVLRVAPETRADQVLGSGGGLGHVGVLGIGEDELELLLRDVEPEQQP